MALNERKCRFTCLGKDTYKGAFTFKYLVMKNSKKQKIHGMMIVKNRVKNPYKKMKLYLGFKIIEIIIINIIIIIIIIIVICKSGHFCNTRLFSNSSFSVLCSKNFEVIKLSTTRYDETNVDIDPFLILNMEKPKISDGVFFGDNKNSLYKLFLQTIVTWVNQFINYAFHQF